MNQMYIGQYQRLEQKLTPQQILLSTLLQLPLLSLEQRIKSELEQNPVLEEGMDTEQEEMSQDEEQEKEVEEELNLHDQGEKGEEYKDKEFEEAQKDTDAEDLFKDDDTFEIKIPKDKNEEEYERPEISQVTIHEHLFEQLHMQNLNENDKLIGEYLIWNIRDDGYLENKLNLNQLSQEFDSTAEHIEKILRQIQKFDPVGVGSRNLQECLLVQLNEQDLPDPIAIDIIKYHFDDFKNSVHYENTIYRRK